MNTKQSLTRIMLILALLPILLLWMPGTGEGFEYDLETAPGADWMEETSDTDTFTNEVTVTRWGTDPDTGAKYEYKEVWDRKTGVVKHYSRKQTMPDGRSRSDTWTNGRKTRSTETDSFGDTTTTRYGEGGRISSETKTSRDGAIAWDQTRSYDPKTGRLTSVTTKNEQGSKTVNAGRDGKVSSIQTTSFKTGLKMTKTCDKAGDCSDFRKEIDSTKFLSPQSQPYLTESQKQKFGGSIGSKPAGQAQYQGVGTGKQKVLTEGLQQQIKNPGEEVGLNPQPLPPKEMTGKATKAVPREYFTGRQKENLPVAPSGQAYQGSGAARQKLQPYFTESQKPKSRVVPRRQTTDQTYQSGAAGKQNVRTQSAQQFKTKPKFRDWSSSADSTGPFRAPR